MCDMSDRITSCDEAYAVTTREGNVSACARSVVHLVRAQAAAAGTPASDETIRYGDCVRIVSNEFICNKSLYLASHPISPLAFARFSRNQEVCLLNGSTYNTVWKIWPAEGHRNQGMGSPVIASQKIILEHCATTQLLSNDRIPYRNDFGNEMEVSCMSAATKHKT